MMTKKKNAPVRVAYAICSLTLFGCSSSDSGDGGNSDDNPASIPEMAAALPVSVSDATSAIISLAECGSIAPGEAIFSSDAATPTAMLPGNLYNGLVDPDSATNQANYWAIDLEPGTYGVFIDSNTLEGDDDNIGLSVYGSVAGEQELRLIRSNEVDQRIRASTLIDVNVAVTLALQVEPRFESEEYTLAVFENGAAVPSPYFSDCPEISDFAIGDSKIFSLAPQINSAVNDVWFRTSLPVDRYTLDATASYLDGMSTNMMYDAVLYDQYGQTARSDTVIRVNEIEVSFTDSGQVLPTEAGVRWLRFVNSHNNALQVEATLSEE